MTKPPPNKFNLASKPKPKPKPSREEKLYKELLKLTHEMELLGYAFIVWTPSEMSGVNPSKLISSSIEHGWDFIDNFTEEEDPFEPDAPTPHQQDTQ